MLINLMMLFWSKRYPLPLLSITSKSKFDAIWPLNFRDGSEQFPFYLTFELNITALYKSPRNFFFVQTNSIGRKFKNYINFIICHVGS